MIEYVRFLTVADEGSITRAAERLGISQPAVSRTIALLEEAFGTPLLKRTAEGVELTSAGKILYEYAGRAARAISTAKEAINHAEFGGKLKLTIAAGDGWGYSVLPSIIRAFCKHDPNVVVSLETVQMEARTQGLRSGRYDLAFGVVSSEYDALDGFEFRPLLEGPFDVYCHVSHPLVAEARSATPTRQTLLAYSWIGHRFEYDYDPAQLIRSARNYAVRTNTMLSAVEILQGSDLLISAAHWFREVFARNNIVSVGRDPEGPNLVSGAIYANRELLSPTARRFLAAVVRHCEGLRPGA